ncbi:hypothetical protein [Marinilactibacillus psychrotolerans]|uniref:Uncharacterized protein n=1 Tax=Marinilactibacillus psychrotolerans TaxID=191770 RepID=A0AAV3WP63_9LACT|nr:hypothetical protein [Marinilactibacillus psychrotolerans]GEL65858.1 hypothetical protein MPS01_00130 [Marinilactibacillus psychrotolerans]GEQ34866.1 hypothetical protein M132T_03740 [Marinilactibacillus psychrotolerans]SDC07205.1 hypothetical protein SAMN04488013_10214 [Marinilactibacillus psychrotolerans]
MYKRTMKMGLSFALAGFVLSAGNTSGENHWKTPKDSEPWLDNGQSGQKKIKKRYF